MGEHGFRDRDNSNRSVRTMAHTILGAPLRLGAVLVVVSTWAGACRSADGVLFQYSID